MDNWRNGAEQLAELRRVRGWAPGSYIGTCSGCGKGFTGDKRARECLPNVQPTIQLQGTPRSRPSVRP